MPGRGSDHARLAVVPWAIWTVLVAGINLTLFVAIRGRWGRETPALAVAALIGTAAGNAVADSFAFDVATFGGFHLAGAVIGAQLALVTTGALATLLFSGGGPGPRRDGAGPGR